VKFEKVPLHTIARVVQGGRHGLTGNNFVPATDGFPAFGAAGLNGYLKSYEFDQAAVVLSSIGARCGKCFVVAGRWSSLANTQVILPDSERADVRFLWYQLNDEMSWLRAGTAQPFIRPSTVKARMVVLPSLREQRRIAAILDKATDLRQKRAESIRLIDDLLRSLFVEMFGDPLRNPKRWPVRRLGECLASIEAGTSLTGEDRPRSVGEWAVAKVSAVTSGRFLPEESKVLRTPPPASRRVTPRKGDLLFSRANTRELVAATCVVENDEPLIVLPDKLWRMTPRADIAEAVYLRFLLSHPSFRQGITRQATGTSGSMLNVSQEKVRGARAPVPPLEIQSEFSTLFWKAESVRSLGVGFLEYPLLASLLHGAFRGQL
jgi:type I restriction enzyme S subunit